MTIDPDPPSGLRRAHRLSCGGSHAGGAAWPTSRMPRFEWDSEKARRNLSKHGVTFEDAMLVWDDPLHLIAFDRIEGGEERWHVMGTAGGVVVLLVVHTYPDQENLDRVRIVGARRATPHERRAYEQGT